MERISLGDRRTSEHSYERSVPILPFGVGGADVDVIFLVGHVDSALVAVVERKGQKLVLIGKESFCDSRLFWDLSFWSRNIYEKEDKGSHMPQDEQEDQPIVCE